MTYGLQACRVKLLNVKRSLFISGVRLLDQIALSTAAFCLWDIQPEEKLHIGRQLGFDHIEIALSTEVMVRKFLNFMNTSELAGSFKQIALHAPWHGIAYGKGARSEKVVAQLNEIVDRLGIQSVVVHCDCIQNPDTLAASGLPIVLENTATPESWERFSSLLMEYPWRVSLNLNKASREHGQLDQILERWRHRIERVHLSGHIESRGRMPLQSTNQLQLIEKLRKLEVPMVIEGLFPPGNPTSIAEERQLVQTAIETLKLDQSS